MAQHRPSIIPVERYTSRAVRSAPRLRPKVLWRLLAALGLVLVIVPTIDLWVASLFFDPDYADPDRRFWLQASPTADFLHEAVQILARGLGFGMLAALAYTAVRLRPLLGLRSREWLFLILALLVGPVLVVNGVFKNHWDRARPVQVAVFGGTQIFTPPLVVADQCDDNCSFVSGDAAVMFYLHSFAYIVRRRRRTVFYAGLGAGVLGGFLRIAMGKHFFSDVLFAGALVVLSSVLVYVLLYGRQAAVALWRDFGLLPGPRDRPIAS